MFQEERCLSLMIQMNTIETHEWHLQEAGHQTKGRNYYMNYKMDRHMSLPVICTTSDMISILIKCLCARHNNKQIKGIIHT